MNRLGMLAGALLVLGAASPIHAQYVQPYGGGTAYNPYVNLLNRNVNPAITYQGIVQPQMQAQSNLQQIQSDIATRSAPPGVGAPRNNGVADTGYSAGRFMQYQQYFLTLPTGRGVNYRTQGGTMSSGTTAATFGRR